jgi:UDP-GlcNAc:undecaprenyl-phosphate GlcNAc-1-phosphate transferase
MTFPCDAYLLAAGSGLVTTAAALPLWRAWCRRAQLVDDPGHRKIHREPIPLAGGLAVLTGILIPLGAAVLLVAGRWLGPATVAPLEYGLGRRAAQVLVLLLGAIGAVVLGWLDDRQELRPHWKFAGQVIIAALVAAGGTRITCFVPNLLFSYVVTILWLVTLMNACNFLDNMNGLCGGVGVIGAFWFALKAAVAGQFLVASMAFLACGALVGFLPYNFPRASVFLGDAGSHLVGYLLGVLAILPHFYSSEHPVRLAVLNPLLILAVPLADLVSVVLIRFRQGRAVYVGDTNHFSHRLVRRGLRPTTAVLVLWLLAAMAGALAFL